MDRNRASGVGALRAPSISRCIALAAPLVASACIQGDTPLDFDDGSFHATISGALSEELEGSAYFDQVDSQQASPGYFVIRLYDHKSDKGEYDIVFYRDAFGVPGAWQYPVERIESLDPPPTEFAAMFVILAGNLPLSAFIANNGSITFNATGASQVQGSFHFSATGRLPEQPGQTVTIFADGNLRAVRRRTELPQVSF